MYHRDFSVKYSDFCNLVILVSLQASFIPVIIKETEIRSRCTKTELPSGYYQKCTSAERNQRPSRAGTSLLDCAHPSPWGRGYMHMPCAHVAFHLIIYSLQNQRSRPHFSLFFFHKFSSVYARVNTMHELALKVTSSAVLVL